MEPELQHKLHRTEVSGAVIEASLWLRLGFFSGLAIVAIALIRYVEGDSALLLSFGSVVFGAALAAFSVRRALGLLERQEVADCDSAPARQRALWES